MRDSGAGLRLPASLPRQPAGPASAGGALRGRVCNRTPVGGKLHEVESERVLAIFPEER